ncbi:RIP metalloprotease RseP [Lactococcus cremoris]|uniref:Zinc metalloprotease n=3 Tax=Lactococcus lactis subsp. cremoris TaxID=1359 RepID=A0A165FD42_LACLC|nr:MULTISPECIES: RIP metalloprotease RseP [Lactococcus]EQC55269.1 metalloprotease RseP [Lactococcus cremoris subsp. cremoris TIFN5]EQC88899.1 metalloprotease RseP [Lactococcus cremoris subsp. cremoris TIFN1]EQC89897.1 metalloprotease RseP [Lactococcus cremoris subsp. cremoris TIFN7]EQC93966.1 metalloprotease RseP [Lactococcus cremoris subsp. cremoris TIFN3]ABJ73876.1 site-2 protease, Metallo peptidase, MEROPS family M50B [Lactococcus cremoris subsp. cremoris SK11]
MIETLITFIIIFGIIVAIHEYGHLWWAKRSGILVREYAVGMGPKIFAHQAKDGTLYTIRILPLGGYVRLAGWGDDKTEIKKGQAASLVVSKSEAVNSGDENSVSNIVRRINLSEHVELEEAVPMLITEYDFEKELFIEGEVFGEIKRYSVDHDATIIEEDGTEVRIVPLDVQYQSAGVFHKMLTNFGGPLNNFILGLVAFIVLTFIQGGVPSNSNAIGQVEKGTPAYTAGLKSGDKIQAVNGTKTADWDKLVTEISSSNGKELKLEIIRSGKSETLAVTPKKMDGSYRVGIMQSMKTGFFDKITGGFVQAGQATTAIFRALGSLIARPSLDKLGGPVAIYQLSGQAARAGLPTIIQLLAMLSINLGIVNLFPIPVLDGGKIVLNIIEAIRGKALSPEKESIITLVGVVFMLVLFMAVTWNDILRAFVN